MVLIWAWAAQYCSLHATTLILQSSAWAGRISSLAAKPAVILWRQVDELLRLDHLKLSGVAGELAQRGRFFHSRGEQTTP